MLNRPSDEPRLSIEAFERLPEEDEYLLELVHGRIVREPRPGHEHGRIVANITFHLRRFVDTTKQGAVFVESGFALPQQPATVRGPDVSFVAAEHLNSPDLMPTFPELAPDLAVEVVSPSNTAADLHAKVREYLNAGSRMVWVIYPRDRTAVAYRASGDAVVLGEDDQLEAREVLPGFTVRLAELFV
jgi:Uma2 family endonuclease